MGGSEFARRALSACAALFRLKLQQQPAAYRWITGSTSIGSSVSLHSHAAHATCSC